MVYGSDIWLTIGEGGLEKLSRDRIATTSVLGIGTSSLGECEGKKKLFLPAIFTVQYRH